MNCEEVKDRLGFLIDGTLEKHEARRVEAHLAGCPDCRRAQRELEIIIGALPEMTAPESSPDFTTRVMAGLEERGVFGTTPAVTAAAGVEEALFSPPPRAETARPPGFASFLSGLFTGRREPFDFSIGLRRGLVFAAAAIYLVIIGWFVGLVVNREGSGPPVVNPAGIGRPSALPVPGGSWMNHSEQEYEQILRNRSRRMVAPGTEKAGEPERPPEALTPPVRGAGSGSTPDFGPGSAPTSAPGSGLIPPPGVSGSGSDK